MQTSVGAPRSGLSRMLRDTLVGGILFLVPVIVLITVLGKALRLTQKVVGPVARALPFESVVGVSTPRLLTVLIILLFCLLAGICARTRLARRAVAWLESTLLSNIPGYSFMKSVAESVAGVESARTHQVVLARLDDAWQIAFLVERIGDSRAVLYVPDAPNPWSGSILVMAEDRLRLLDVPLPAVLKCLKSLGLGAGAMLGDTPIADAPQGR